MFESPIFRVIDLLLFIATGTVVMVAILGALVFYDKRKGHSVD